MFVYDVDGFIRGILHTLSSKPWCPVPNLYWCSALSNLSANPVLSETSLSLIIRIIQTDCQLCERNIRRATQKYLYITALNLIQVIYLHFS